MSLIFFLGGGGKCCDVIIFFLWEEGLGVINILRMKLMCLIFFWRGGGGDLGERVEFFFLWVGGIWYGNF